MSASMWAPMISRSSGGPLICLSAPLRRPPVLLGALWLRWWQRRDICGWPCQIWRTKTGSANWTPRSHLLACSATLSTRLSTGFRRRVSKRRRSSGSSLAALGLRGLLGGRSPRRVPAPHTGRLKKRALPLVLPRGGARSSATRLGLQSRSRIWGPYLWLGGPRRKSPDTWGCRTSEGRPLWGREELQVAYLSPVPSTLRSVRRKGTETHVTPEGVYKTDSSGPAWRCAVTGVRATASNTRVSSLSRLFRSFCGPRTSSSHWEHCIFLGTWMWDQTYCRDRGRGPGNGCFTPRWWSRYGECFIRRRWTSSQLEWMRNVPSGSL